MTQKPNRLTWPLWSFALSCSWLLPAFSQLWPSFDMELLGAICCLSLICSKRFFTHQAAWLPTTSLAVAAASLIPLIQFITGEIHFFGDAWMSAAYLLGFAYCIFISTNLRNKSEFCDAFTGAVAFAAVVSVGVAIAQWLGSQGLGVWVRALPPGDRPFANLGQPNNLATLVTWGLIAIWYGFLSKTIRPSISLIAAAYLLFGLSLTQSRSGWLNVCTLLTVAIVFRKRFRVAGYWRFLILLAAQFLAMVLLLDQVSAAVGTPSINPLASRMTAGYRLDHWRSMLLAISMKPWLGWGWNQVSVAQQAVAPDLPHLPEMIGYSHNLLIDLLIWNGVPVGAALFGLVIAWFIKAIRSSSTPQGTLIILMLVTLFTHSLVEFPYAYAYFLMPAGLLVGVATTPARGFQLRQPRLWAISLAMSSFSVIWLTTRDYLEARQSFTALRFEKAHVGTSRDSRPPVLPFLTQLQALATTDRLKFGQVASSDIDLLRRTAERFPAERTLMQYAVAAAAIHDTSAASLSLVKLCKLHSEAECVYAKEIWKEWGQSRFPWLESIPFPALR